MIKLSVEICRKNHQIDFIVNDDELSITNKLTDKCYFTLDEIRDSLHLFFNPLIETPLFIAITTHKMKEEKDEIPNTSPNEN